jgi:hypothetical protein
MKDIIKKKQDEEFEKNANYLKAYTLYKKINAQLNEVINNYSNDIYNLNGNITYNESIIEVLNNILEMDNNQYKRLLYKMRICKKLIIEKNRKILSQLN